MYLEPHFGSKRHVKYRYLSRIYWELSLFETESDDLSPLTILPQTLSLLLSNYSPSYFQFEVLCHWCPIPLINGNSQTKRIKKKKKKNPYLYRDKSWPTFLGKSHSKSFKTYPYVHITYIYYMCTDHDKVNNIKSTNLNQNHNISYHMILK